MHKKVPRKKVKKVLKERQKTYIESSNADRIQRSSQNWIYYNPQELLRNMFPGAAYKGILSGLTTHLTAQCPPSHVPRGILKLVLGRGRGRQGLRNLIRAARGGGVRYSLG